MVELRAFVHVPSPRMNDALRPHARHEPIEPARAGAQHAAYRRMLESCGVAVEVVDVNREHPDAAFIEDCAILLDELAIVSSMGAPARAAEPAGIEPALRRVRSEVARIGPGATLEGGDVLRAGRKLLVGISARTNARGVAALAEIVRPHGYAVLPVRVSGCLHLKTACTALPDGTLLLNPRWVDLAPLVGFELLGVAVEEPHAANVLLAGDVVCAASSAPATVDELRRRGLDVRTVDLSEFAKADGGPTCLSLLFRA